MLPAFVRKLIKVNWVQNNMGCF